MRSGRAIVVLTSAESISDRANEPISGKLASTGLHETSTDLHETSAGLYEREITYGLP